MQIWSQLSTSDVPTSKPTSHAPTCALRFFSSFLSSSTTLLSTSSATSSPDIYTRYLRTIYPPLYSERHHSPACTRLYLIHLSVYTLFFPICRSLGLTIVQVSLARRRQLLPHDYSQRANCLRRQQRVLGLTADIFSHLTPTPSTTSHFPNHGGRHSTTSSADSRPLAHVWPATTSTSCCSASSTHRDRRKPSQHRAYNRNKHHGKGRPHDRCQWHRPSSRKLSSFSSNPTSKPTIAASWVSRFTS